MTGKLIYIYGDEPIAAVIREMAKHFPTPFKLTLESTCTLFVPFYMSSVWKSTLFTLFSNIKRDTVK